MVTQRKDIFVIRDQFGFCHRCVGGRKLKTKRSVKISQGTLIALRFLSARSSSAFVGGLSCAKSGKCILPPRILYAAVICYAHSTMETKVEAMNCIEKYLWFRLRCGQKSGQNLYIVYKHESFYTRILQKMLINTKKDLHFCKSLSGAKHAISETWIVEVFWPETLNVKTIFLPSPSSESKT